MNYEAKTSINLVDFQNNLLGKIGTRNSIENYVASQWLGFVVSGVNYAVPLSNIKEVITAPEGYLNLGDWVSRNTKGGIQHRDEIWAVYEGVECNKESVHKTGKPWEYRILLIKPDYVDGNFAIAVDKIHGLLPDGFFQENEPSLNSEWGVDGHIKIGSAEKWKAWNPQKWTELDEVKLIMRSQK